MHARTHAHTNTQAHTHTDTHIYTDCYTGLLFVHVYTGSFDDYIR